MGLKNSFTKNQMLYSGKKTTVNLGPNQLSQFPKLGNNTVEKVREVFLQNKFRNSQNNIAKKEEIDKKDPKINSSIEQYRKIQAMFNTKIKK